MTPRREAILDAIVREYTETAVPVGSLVLAQKYKFPFSPATIRAEMALLEEDGYIVQPHTSAGRVPTQKGYRYYVNMIEEETGEIVSRENESLRRRIGAMHSRYEKMFDVATRALSEITRNVSLGSFGGDIYSHGLARLFRQPEFVDVGQVLKVADLIDNLPELLQEIPRNKEFMVFIGSETPIGKSANISLVMARINLPDEFGYLGVLGPTRMSYERIIPLVARTKKMMEETA